MPFCIKFISGPEIYSGFCANTSRISAKKLYVNNSNGKFGELTLFYFCIKFWLCGQIFSYSYSFYLMNAMDVFGKIFK